MNKWNLLRIDKALYNAKIQEQKVKCYTLILEQDNIVLLDIYTNSPVRVSAKILCALNTGAKVTDFHEMYFLKDGKPLEKVDDSQIVPN